jgi:hypothetical protein
MLAGLFGTALDLNLISDGLAGGIKSMIKIKIKSPGTLQKTRLDTHRRLPYRPHPFA